ncbi:helix-turn-helix domain-containing protein [Pseudonocardia humida]|uniref:Helix-turn-helix transcriptional regulator n=1 Tax=Pseudonocardia humida TaxID=2800819 RepID=A0ABT1AC75_9PSEU|nr:XRE family transcriptional regulator [Pseudonocardia humida]MCO1660598.1 helix-turn-helix transcriptional regulator [Pseudonocardia humida]
MPADADIDLRVAQRLRELRTERSATLSSVAELTGISTAHLSRLEKGERQPSIGTLLQLARVYGTTVGDLVEDVQARGHHLVRAGEAAVTRGREGEYAVLSGPRTNILAVSVRIGAGQSTLDARHPGEEWLRVLTGRAALRLDGEDIALFPGDCVHFDAARPHRLSAPTDDATEILVVSAAGRVPAHHPLPRPPRH